LFGGSDRAGFRTEFAEAILAGIPVLTAIPEKRFEAWVEFTGDRGTTLPCARYVIEGWSHHDSSRMACMPTTCRFQ
jgi:molybdate transport system ATP-binding protein